MTQGKDSHVRRVSFAPEPTINYITTDEYNSTKTSSSMNDISMDITTNLNELKNIKLLAEKAKNEFEKFKNPYDEDRQDQIEEYYNYVESFSHRFSLDPIRAMQEIDTKEKMNTSFNKDQITEDYTQYVDNESASRPTRRPSVDAVISTAQKQIQREDLSEEISNIGRKSSLINNKRSLSIGNNFNDTGIINSSYTVEELVNTVELRKIVPQTIDETISVSDFLSQQGIRFLDEAVFDGMRRDTLSKSRNIVDPAMEIYYKYSLKERIDFLYNLSTFLIDRMKEVQLEIEETEKNIDVNEINKDSLKRIRNEARNKSKIDWYGLRKIYELQFNKRIIESKNNVLLAYNEIKRENEKIKEIIDEKNAKILESKNKLANIKGSLNSNQEGKLQEVEVLKKMIEERNTVLDEALVEKTKIREVFDRSKLETTHTGKEIYKLRTETENLKKNLIIKNVTESQLNDMKKYVDRFRIMFGIKLVRIFKNDLILDIYGNILRIDALTLKFIIDVKDSDPYFELAKSSINSDGVNDIRGLICNILRKFFLVLAIKKEIGNIKEKMKVETFYLNGCLYLRLFIDVHKNVADLNITSDFMLRCGDVVLFNLIHVPGGLSQYISSIL